MNNPEQSNNYQSQSIEHYETESIIQELFGNIIDHVHERKEVHKNFIEYTQQILTTTEQQQIIDMFGGKNLKGAINNFLKEKKKAVQEAEPKKNGTGGDRSKLNQLNLTMLFLGNPSMNAILNAYYDDFVLLRHDRSGSHKQDLLKKYDLSNMTPEEVQIFKKNHEIEINKNNIKDIDKLEQKGDESLDYKKTKSEALKDITDPEFIGCKEKVYDIYNNLKNREGLSFKAFLTSYVAFSNAKKEKKIPKDDVFTVLDFSKPNNEERLFVIDLNMSDVVIKSKAGHGKNSGSKYAESFSNENGTNKSSVGLFITPNKSEKNSKGTWTGLRLQGLEKGINDKAASRGLFLHPASVTGSLGCITIPDKSLTKKLVSKLVGGYPIYIYTDKKKYLSSSKLLNGNTI